MSSLAARRKQRYRQRQRDGLVVLKVPVCEHALAEAMIQSGRLSEMSALDRMALEREAGAILKQWLHQWRRPQ